MNKSSNNFLRKIKPLLNEVEDSLPYIKDIFLTPIAYGFALGERYLQEVSKRQEEAKKQAEISSQQRIAEERTKIMEERKAQETARIAEERRAEERARRVREEERKLTPRKVFHTVLSATSTVALVVGVARLAPIAMWTKHVNNCIQESYIEKPNDMTLRERVKVCSKG